MLRIVWMSLALLVPLFVLLMASMALEQVQAADGTGRRPFDAKPLQFAYIAVRG